MIKNKIKNYKLYLLSQTEVAFTLAETLITLVIVGLVAALTIPSMIAKYQEQQTVSKLKKAYSILSQTTNRLVSEEGPITSWPDSQEVIFNWYKKKLINIKDCNNKTGCFTQGKYKGLNNSYTTDWDHQSVDRRFILSDGTQVNFEMFHHDCKYVGNGSRNACTIIDVDLNGEKKPNKVGRDFFSFALKAEGLVPAGCDYDQCNKSTIGTGCACKVLRENGINY